MSGDLQDLKEALTSATKPDITHVRYSFLVYAARACEYGSAKYQRANYARPVETRADDFRRLRAYTRAAVAHLVKMLDEMEHHEAGDPDLADHEGMRAAAYAAYTDASPRFAASGLPHLAHACASLVMAVEQATCSGLLPADPGQPWTASEPDEQDDRVVSASGVYEMLGGYPRKEVDTVREVESGRALGVWADRVRALRHLEELDARHRVRAYRPKEPAK